MSAHPHSLHSAAGGADAGRSVGARRGSRQHRLITWALFFGGFSTFAQLYCMQPLLPLLSQHFNITPAQSSWTVSASTLTMAVGLLATSVVADRISRKRLMCVALLGSSILTVLSAFAPGFGTLVALSALKGLALSGLPAIAMTYVAEEIDPASLGWSMGLYIGGNILGGMLGRVLSSLLADAFSWRVATGAMGVLCLAMGLEFMRSLPASKRFVPGGVRLGDWLGHARRHLGDPVLLGLYMFGGLMMGSFVSVYNYLGFRLAAPPFSLPHAVIGATFSMYLIGVVGSFTAGPLSDRLGRRRLLWSLVAVALLGLWLMAAARLAWIVIGLALLTLGFFGGHTVASSWVGYRARQGRALASALYLFCYYLGSSVLGTYSGVVMHAAGWHGVVLLLSGALIVTLAISLALRRARPAV